MALEFRLPDIGEGVVEGEIVRWLVKEGDVLREDQPMVEVMTDKATVEIPTPRAGRVTKLMMPAGQICAVGQVMIVIESEGGAAAPAPSATAHATPAPAHAAPAPSRATAAPAPAHSHGSTSASTHGASSSTNAPAAFFQAKVLAAPATRQLARTLGIDIRTVRGSGPGGRITKDDVRAATESARAPKPASSAAPARPAAAPAAPAPIAPQPVAPSAGDERIPFRGVRKKIADNLVRSQHATAPFTYVEECDVTELVKLRARAKKRAEERGVKLTFLPFIIKAVVSGLKKFPIVNSTLDATTDEIVLRKSYHLGVATATDNGLIVPVLRDADKLSLFQIAAAIEPLSERARTGKASRDELTGSTFTISSLGTLGGVLATPIINFPEVAVLGVHKIRETPAVRNGEIVIRSVMNLSITLDHRIVDGYEGAKFIQHVVELLQDPTLLFMEMV